MSSVALYKRLRTSAAWLGWIAAELCREFREAPRLPDGLRLRAIDGSTLCKPGSKGTDWRLHYMLDLRTLSCDWLELTDGSKGETLARAPIGRGDVILGDRHFSRLKDLQFAASRPAHILVRIRWRHARMQTAKKRNFEVLKKARRLRVGQVKSWPVHWVTPKGTQPVSGRVVAIRLPAPVAERTKQRIRRRASRKGRNTDPRTLEAAHFVMVFTTLPESLLSDEGILDLYRFRWQIEIAFKRHKQLLRLGRLPHTNPETGRSWILAKLVVALLLGSCTATPAVFPPGGTASNSQRVEGDGDTPNRWRWTAVLLPALRQALCPIPRLSRLVVAIERGNVTLNEPPRRRTEQHSTLAELLVAWILVNAHGAAPPLNSPSSDSSGVPFQRAARVPFVLAATRPRIAGRFVDAVTGRGVAVTSVTCVLRAGELTGSSSSRAASLGSDGSFWLDRIPNEIEEVRLEVTVPDSHVAPQVLSLQTEPESQAANELAGTLPSLRPAEDIRVPLTPARSIHGLVIASLSMNSRALKSSHCGSRCPSSRLVS